MRRSSADEYRTARELVTIVEQFDALDSPPASDRNQRRDRFMADNILRLVRSEPGVRVALWAANAYIAAEPYFGVTSMGSFLRQALGSDYLPIGFAFRRGSFNAVGIAPRRALMQFTLEPPKTHTLDETLAGVGLPAFLVRWGGVAADEPVASWLSARHRIRQIGAAYGESMAAAFLQPIRPERSYDAIIFFDEISPSHVLHGRPLFEAKTLPAPDNLDFEQASGGTTPAAWTVHPFAILSGYRAEVSAEACHGGHACALVDRPARLEIPTSGALFQQIDAASYRDKAVHVRAAVRTESPATRAPYAGAVLWVMALDGNGNTLELGSTRSTRLRRSAGACTTSLAACLLARRRSATASRSKDR